MEKEVKLWLDKAKKDLEVAEYNLNGGKLDATALFCQQSVEKALKAVYIQKNKKLAPKTHDLTFLAKEVGLPDNLIKSVKPLTNIYMETRYPDLGESIKLKEGYVNELVKLTKEILKWCETKI